MKTNKKAVSSSFNFNSLTDKEMRYIKHRPILYVDLTSDPELLHILNKLYTRGNLSEEMNEEEQSAFATVAHLMSLVLDRGFRKKRPTISMIEYYQLSVNDENNEKAEELLMRVLRQPNSLSVRMPLVKLVRFLNTASNFVPDPDELFQALVHWEHRELSTRWADALFIYRDYSFC